MSVDWDWTRGRHRPRPHPRAGRGGERRVLQGRPRAARHSADLGGERGAQFANLVVTDDEPTDERPGAHRVRRRLARAGRRLPPRGHRGRRTDNGAPGVREQYSSPRAAATTRRSCSTPTATTSRPSAASSTSPPDRIRCDSGAEALGDVRRVRTPLGRPRGLVVQATDALSSTARRSGRRELRAGSSARGRGRAARRDRATCSKRELAPSRPARRGRSRRGTGTDVRTPRSLVADDRAESAPSTGRDRRGSSRRARGGPRAEDARDLGQRDRRGRTSGTPAPT